MQREKCKTVVKIKSNYIWTNLLIILNMETPQILIRTELTGIFKKLIKLI